MKGYLAIITVIVVSAGLAWQQSQQPPSAVDATSKHALQQWPQITPAAVASIQLRHNGTTTKLDQHRSQWMVSDQYGAAVAANQALVAQLLKTVTHMRPQRVVSSNPENFSRFRLTDDADRLTLKGENGNVLLDILVGKSGSNLISTTVRQVGDNVIINVNRSLAWQLGKSAASWR